MRKSGSIVVNHLSIEELRDRMSACESIEQFRRYQVIFLRKSEPELPVAKVAQLCTAAYRTVTQWTWQYNKLGPDEYILSGKGGRRRCLLPEAEETALLERLSAKAEKGQIITALSVKKAAEKVLDRNLSKDYAYDLLHRHRWRKIMPHTHHPKQNPEKREAFKKTSRICWLPPEKN
jgi:transposase